MNKNAMYRVFAFLVIFLVSLSPLTVLDVKAQPRTIVVPEDFSTIQEAIDAASNGDEVFIKQGTYNERLLIDKALQLNGENKETTILNGNNAGTVITIRHDNVIVTNLTVQYAEKSNTPDPYFLWSSRLAGIHLISANNCTISNNKVSENGAGIWLYDSSQNKITNNSISHNDYGIRIESSSNNTITGNLITENWGGLWLISSSENKLRDNKMANNARNFGISSSNLSNYVNDVDSSNTVDQKPICYWVGVTEKIVPSDAGCVILVNCVGIIVQGLNLNKNQNGILLAFTHNTIIKNNQIGSSEGVGLYDSSNCIISNNQISGDTSIKVIGNETVISSNRITASQTGIILTGSFHTVVGNTVQAGTVGSGNNILECQGSYNNISSNILSGQTYVGIELDGSFNLFYDNVVNKGEKMRINGDGNIIAKNIVTDSGIGISSGSNNVVCANRITNGYGLGIGGNDNLYYANHLENNNYGATIAGTASGRFNNTIYQNNFVNNDLPVKNWAGNTANYWDNGFNGNYWSDYVGSDENNDGIGDVPYLVISETLDKEIGKVIDFAHGQDNYPLITPFDIDSVDLKLPDLTPPLSVLIINPKNIRYTTSFVNLSFTLNKPASWLGYSLNGNEAVSIDGNMTLSGLSQAEHNLVVYARDLNGSLVSKDVDFVVDLPPSIGLLIGNQTYGSSELKVEFIVEERNSWMGFSLDGGANVTVEGNFSLNELDEGSHSLVVYAMDSGGNLGVSDLICFQIEFFPTTLVAVSVSIIAIVGLGIFAYFKKYRRRS